MGLLYLASTIKANSHHDVRIIDCQLRDLNEEEIRSEILQYAPDIVGITTVTFSLIDSIMVAEITKSCTNLLRKPIYVVAGGPHVTIFPEETAKLDNFDFALAGEAEFTFLDLINHLNDESVLQTIPGLHYQKNGITVKGPPYGYIEDLDSIPIPDRTLVDYTQYYNVLSGSGKMTTMMTSRGCPYRCIFCDRLGKRFRPASADYVIMEIEKCLQLGIKHIFFHDDTLTVDKNRVLSICRIIKEKSLEFSFSLRSRVNTIDEEMVRALKEAGCKRISFGVESGVQRILKRIKKGITLEQAEDAFRLTKKFQIKSLADFMIGHPDETVEDIRQTIKFAKKLKPDYVQFSVTTPYPATDLYREGLETGIIDKDYWKEFAENPNPNFIPPRWEQNISKYTLYEILHQCYKEFYLSPKFIIKNLLEIKNLQEFNRMAKAGIRILMNEIPLKLIKRDDGFR